MGEIETTRVYLRLLFYATIIFFFNLVILAMARLKNMIKVTTVQDSEDIFSFVFSFSIL